MKNAGEIYRAEEGVGEIAKVGEVSAEEIYISKDEREVRRRC